MLDEALDDESAVEQRGEDLAQAVIPVVGRRIGERGVSGIGALLIPRRHTPFEVRQVDHNQLVVPILVQRPGQWMTLSDEEPASRAQEVIDHRRPGVNVGQPAQGPHAGVNHVELFIERCGRVVQLALDEPARSAGSLEHRAGSLNGAGSEIEAGDLGAEPGQRQGVGPDMTLQMDDPLAGEVAQPGKVELHHVR